MALQAPAMLREKIRLTGPAPLWHPGLKKIGRLMLPTVLGAAAYQVNVLVGTLLASMLSEGSVSYLYYADRLVQFPLGIFAIATATAVLPSLSRQAAAGDLESVGKTFRDALQMVSFITLPAMAGLIVLRTPIIALLFERGAFDAQSTRLTAVALLYYGMGLWAFSAVRVVVSAFYALQDMKTPLWAAVASVVCNIAFGVLFMGSMGHGGLALAASLASFVNLALLLRALKTRLGFIGAKRLATSLLRSAAGAAAMGLGVWGLALKGIPERFWEGSGLPWALGASLALGIVLYGVFSLMMGSQEWKRLFVLAGKGRVQDDD